MDPMCASPTAFCSSLRSFPPPVSRDGGIFDEGDFGNLGSLGESSTLFQSDLHMEQDSDWDVNDLAVFNGFEFDDVEPLERLLKSPRKARAILLIIIVVVSFRAVRGSG